MTGCYSPDYTCLNSILTVKERHLVKRVIRKECKPTKRTLNGNANDMNGSDNEITVLLSVIPLVFQLECLYNTLSFCKMSVIIGYITLILYFVYHTLVFKAV